MTNYYTDQLYDIVEQATRDELVIRPNQDPNSVAHAVAREVIRRLHENELKVIDSRPFFVYDSEGCQQ